MKFGGEIGLDKMHSTGPSLRYTWHTRTSEGVQHPSNCRIVVVGVGGAGSNTVSRLTETGVEGAECIAINTDALHLNNSRAHQKILIGEKLTRGLGVGGDPKLGRAAIEESRDRVEDLLKDANIVFITAGVGGGGGGGGARADAGGGRG